VVLGIALLTALAAAGPPPPAQSVPTIQPAQASACTSNCRAAYNQCRIANKGSPACDAQLQACMQACVATRR
jgi:hypothetical protein